MLARPLSSRIAASFASGHADIMPAERGELATGRQREINSVGSFASYPDPI
jgi:hypothetical protein